MLICLLGGIVATAAFIVHDLLRTRRALTAVDLDAMLEMADRKLDEAIRALVEDGTIRLLRCSWLLSTDASGAILCRQQDLPPEAFFSCNEAAELLGRGDRSVLALSYRWLTAVHPDPFGSTLAAVRRYLASDPRLASCGLFWDFGSLSQKPRTSGENAAFKRGLKVMTNVYASLASTAVVQLKDIPPRPREYNGRVTVFDAPAGASSGSDGIDASVRADLGRFGGTVEELSVDPGFLRGDEGSVANVCFASHEQALRCIDALKVEKRGAATVYNETAYDRNRDDKAYSGWCTMEQGMATLAAAHLGQAAQLAERRGRRLASRFVRARKSRPKLTDISDGGIVVRCGADLGDPAALRDQIFDAIERATFVGNADRVKVKRMCFDYEWAMKRAVEQAEAADARSGLTLDRKTTMESIAKWSANSDRSSRRVFPLRARSGGPSAGGPSAPSLDGEVEEAAGGDGLPPKPAPQTELAEL